MRVPLVLLALLLAGCADPDPSDRPARIEDAPSSEREAPAWPDPEDAPIRPGVRIKQPRMEGARFNGAVCSGNFIFRSPDNLSLYLGTAAHCYPNAHVGDAVAIDGYDMAASATGTIAYHSFRLMEAASPLAIVEDDQGEATPDNNDLALIRIDDAFRSLVHPAMLHYGGPTGIVAVANAREGVATYGGSGLRGSEPSLRPVEGCVVAGGERATRIRLDQPGVPGDSGSAVLLADGRALGVLTHLGPGVGSDAPFVRPGTNYVTNLAAALAFARESGGLDVELVTWPLFEPPRGPLAPCLG